MSVLSIKPPPVEHTADGHKRRVGLEIEFAAPDLLEIAEAVADFSEGHLEEVSEFEYRICESAFGDFTVELDMRWLKEMGKEAATSQEEKDSFARWTRSLLGKAMQQIVPIEIVFPPLEWDRLNEFNPLLNKLRKLDAKGTAESSFYAFGLHVNVEAADLSSPSLLNHMRAFCCLFDWLCQACQVDFARRVTPFVNRFPVEYEQMILDLNYHPGLDNLIADYLVENDTRNRALDMLPIMAFLNEEAVRDALPEEKIFARPTYHYRLPNCDIDRPDWNPIQAWNDWVRIERLAHTPDALAEICEARLQDMDRLTSRVDDYWLERSQRWLL